MNVYAATKNEGKFRELCALSATLGWDVRAYADYRDVVEDAPDYGGNARLKARALAEQLRSAEIVACALGDDSGLEVEALGGRPGLYSARYGPPGSTWAEKRRLLLAEVDATGDSERRARFVCAISLILPDGREATGFGFVRGVIAPSERGESGFGYDAIFSYPPLGATFGELREAVKNAVGHRTVALAAAAAALARMESASLARTKASAGT